MLCVLGPQTSARGHALVADSKGYGAGPPGEVSHQYRIAGKVRLLFFWASAHDVGGARITWRKESGGRSLSLLIGSEPGRAPRRVNEWGYIREDVAADAAMVFGIRTTTEGDSPGEADARRPQQGQVARLGVLCSTVSNVEVRARTATVFVPSDLTYRDFARVLDRVERHERWNVHGTTRPPGSAPGFLTALDSLLRATAASVRAEPHAYVYKDAVFDLIPRRVRRLEQLRLPTGVFHNVLSTDIAIRNRATGWTGNFSIAYGTEGALAGIPIKAEYQPNWWFKVQLELYDNQDVPRDPANEFGMPRRIADLCVP